jgi:SH3 domain-containing YSC84-like protein 1
MRTLGFMALIAVACASVSTAAMNEKERKRIAESVTVLQELHSAPDRDIPADLWRRAACVAVIPSLKRAAFVFGGEYGKGVVSCRTATGWSAPSFLELEKGSWGFQIGGESVDLVLLVMKRRGMEKLLQDKVSLGAEASLAAGPVGRDARAATDAQMNAEMLSYSRSQGLFAGIDISGGVLKPDKDANADLYGTRIDAREILTGGTHPIPAGGRSFTDALAHITGSVATRTRR